MTMGFGGKVRIRFAEYKDIPAVMEFIDTHWKKGHIMGRDRRLFEFQHLWGEEVSFAMAEEGGQVKGILGFIPYGSSRRDATLAIWKALKTSDTMLGIHILEFLRKNGDIRFISAPGINPRTVSVYQFLGLNTGRMAHWYRLRRGGCHKIAHVTDPAVPRHAEATGLKISPVFGLGEGFDITGCLRRDRQLYKSPDFIGRRYFKHPVFEYLKYGVELGEEKLFVVLRVQPCNGSKALRLIDCIGDHGLIRFLAPMLDRLLDSLGCEYVDCYEAGVDGGIFRDGGWLPVPGSGNTIPEYFSPFEQKNIDIYYMSEIDGAILFKGDGDMDRPN
ncbi:hypothetical protein D3Z51_18940 [Clostridiaceae bacterium]|nr:hypothetical protein [Clostridiaceae bacterium]RKI08569.1 hypothetical protein D7V81_18785 [bacterium 1XD21-70]